MKKLTLALAVAAFTACSNNTDVFDAGELENNLKVEFSENFVKAYPKVDLNQSWDFSTKQTSYGLPAQSAASRMTRAGGYSMTEGEPYEVDPATSAWLNSMLKEKKNNRALGKAFTMSVPNNSFTIVPIYQGEAELIWDLHMVVDGVDILVWSKCQNVWVKKNATDENWITLEELSPNKELTKSTIGTAAVKATPYTFENLPVGADIYFYLKVTGDAGNHVASRGAEQSSLDQMMVALEDCPVPANLPEGSKVTIIGCEDLKISSDWDMNDVVFMVYGTPEVPKARVIEEGDPVEQKKTVRYMIEDLGSTNDFDFNDIVLDVSEIRTTTPVYTNGIVSSWKETGYRQEAVIRHLGGQLPFKLTIGDTQLEEHAGVLGSNPDEKFDVTGWDITKHNVSVEVRSKLNSEVYNNVKFPKAGEAPMIIAVDPTTQWMQERVSVPESWFYVSTEE